MSASSNDLPESDALHEIPSSYQLELPVEPGYRERPPRGSWEAGYVLSLEALKMVKDRPEVFARRDQLMCSVEFVL